MHGIIHAELKRFVVAKYDLGTWNKLLYKAKLQHKYFLTGETYPDKDALNIVAVACEMTGLKADELLEAFGGFIVPTLLKLYGSLIQPSWKTEEFLMNTEETIHRVVRMKNPGAAPPMLNFERLEPGKLKFVYSSERQMAALSIGIMKAVASHFNEDIKIYEKRNDENGVEMLILISDRTGS